MTPAKNDENNMESVLGSSFRQREAVIEDFEARWLRGGQPEIERLISNIDDDKMQPLLLELIQSDLEFRLKSDSAFRIEYYFDRFKHLTQNSEAVLVLIQSEFRLRRRTTPNLDIGEYGERFSDLLPTICQSLDQLSNDTLEFDNDFVIKGRRLGLLVSNGPLSGTRFGIPPDRSLIVGRGLMSDTNINDPHMSRIHFCVTQKDPKYKLEDAGSQMGTVVNGTKVATVELRTGDVIHAGETFFRFQLL